MSNPNDSYVSVSASGVGFVGPDATALFAACALKSGMYLYLKTGMKANRAYTPTNMRTAATRYTGKQYANSRKGLEAAMADMQVWIDTMKAALPVVHTQS